MELKLDRLTGGIFQTLQRLLKKAYELYILCDVEVAFIVLSSRSRLYKYADNRLLFDCAKVVVLVLRYSTVLLLDRVVHALNLNLKAQTRANGGLSRHDYGKS
ncbi:hypothetical protein M8C21_034001 [Ambrosia artemisiifolia]|uniref:MADS-box domain-containing protein n=1 Tax=Ambrosia artemisiifolia TaxID=4212 RepID=A0AAD5GM67_AMBAR|nr:hypothetical protein M8C21_034001 [Ambrosia artemisiifolia]